jgi:hypothetical protein
LRSYAWAAASDGDGRQFEAHLTFGAGFSASAAIAVAVAVRILDAPRPCAWTPGALAGVDVARMRRGDMRTRSSGAAIECRASGVGRASR